MPFFGRGLKVGPTVVVTSEEYIKSCGIFDNDEPANKEQADATLAVKAKFEDFRKAMYDQMEQYTDQGRIKINRQIYLNELRSGKWKKGCIKSDEFGKPIIETPQDNDGTCACAIMLHLFSPNEKTSTTKSRNALGLSGHDCYFIQHCLNDGPFTFPQIADILERTVFRRVEDLENYQYGAGDILCKVCGHPFSAHPNAKGAQYLTVLCDGLLVKL